MRYFQPCLALAALPLLGGCVVTTAVDVATAPRLREQLIALVNEQRYHLVVSLEGVDFIDSSGLRALLTCKDDAEHTGGCLQVREVQAFQRRLLEITGLDKVLDLVDDDEDRPAPADRRGTGRSSVQSSLTDA